MGWQERAAHDTGADDEQRRERDDGGWRSVDALRQGGAVQRSDAEPDDEDCRPQQPISEEESGPDLACGVPRLLCARVGDQPGHGQGGRSPARGKDRQR